MAEAVLKGALGNLASLAGTELGLLLGFDGDRGRLESMFNAIKATLEDAEEKQFSDKATKDWLGKLKDAAYELDDILEECAYEELGSEYEEVKCCVSEMVLSSSLSSFHPMHLFFRYTIARRMKRISERLDQIAKEKDQLRLTSTVQGGTGGVPEWRQTMSSVSEPQVFGREEDTEKIVDFLIGHADVSRSENLLVYPIVGLGGIGKTTLARHIFHHERVVNHFELKCWVCVSEDFSLNRIMEAIIEATPCRGLDLEALQRRLQDQLRGKLFLIVLDDVWDDNNWVRLKSVLACGAKGSSILVTTRHSRVAESMGSTPHPHELAKLSDNDCWELFKNQAFKTNEEEQAELEVIGRKIVKKCKGVPLAAKAVGGILRFRRNTNQWHNVLESNLLELSDNQDSIMSVLRLSYLKLPIKLRQYFAFCAIFPKDAEIRKQYLIELWMANGFISSNGMLDAEEVGDEVWNELHGRSFFQDIEKDEFGKVKSFKMHDLFHDLAQLVAEDVCCITGDNGVATLSERIHHVSNHRLLWISFEEANSIQLHRVRSLRTYICQDLYHFADQLSSHVLKCYSLRVLDFVKKEKLPSSIGDLKHLRYLNLSWGRFETLPESLCKLWNLQILKLDYCECLQKLPNSLIRLKALQQLSLNCCSRLSSLPPHIGKLTSLRILSNYFVGNEGGFLLAELGPLNLKGDLCIMHMEKIKSVMDAKEANMSSKQLNKLYLSWNRYEEEWELQEDVEEILEVLQPNTQQLLSLEVVEYKGAHFPQWMSSPSLKYLSHLVLRNCKSCLQLPALDKLLSLKSLEISSMTNVKYIYEECYDGREVFKALESLTLRWLPNLIRLSREDGENMFPCLSELVIIGCPRFLEEEVSLQGLHSLKKLRIYRCDKFNVSASSQCLTCIQALTIYACWEMEGLQVLQHMTALKELALYDLPKLESLPDCFGNLPLLHELNIFNCLKLTCLPASVSLSNLKSLRIAGCPELEKRCEKETGENWPKIAHIPSITVG